MSPAKVDTWMPLYVGDYLRDTQHLSPEEHGAYLLLIMACWTRGGSLPGDERQLAGIAKLTPAGWKRARATLMAFFTIEGGAWRHRRVEKELGDWRERKDKATERAEHAAKKRWEKERQRGCLEHASGNAQALLEECPSPSSTEVRAPNEALTLCERDAPILPREGQSAITPEGMTADERRAYAESMLASLGPKRVAG